jgi:hypothetical protein
MSRGARRKSLLPVVGLALVGALAMARPAAADVVPFVDCVGAGSGVVHVYFGYTNDGSQQSIEFGDQNQVVPGLGYQGQPTVFNPGTYPRVFRAIWNQEAFSAITWVLNGHEAIATRAGPSPSPTCVAGATGPASDLTPTTATLSAIVGVTGQETTYHFEYGAWAVPDQITPVAIVGLGQHGLVQEELTGLTPGTLYRYRVVATNEDGTTEGELRTFTTPAAAVPVDQPPIVTPLLEPFAISARAAAARSIVTQRRRCPQQAAAGVAITSNRAGTASLRAKLGTLTVATRRIALAEGRNVVALCLNRAGRKQLASRTRTHRLRARVVVAARADGEASRASLRATFTRGT